MASLLLESTKVLELFILLFALVKEVDISKIVVKMCGFKVQ